MVFDQPLVSEDKISSSNGFIRQRVWMRYGVLVGALAVFVWGETQCEKLLLRAIAFEPSALYTLGAKYANGKCCERNDTMAYALWESVNAPEDANLTSFVQTQKYKLANRMSALHINEAQTLSQDKEKIVEILKNKREKFVKKEEKEGTK